VYAGLREISGVRDVNDNRYQFQPPHIKAYRWLRYVPCYALIGVWRVFLWALRGMPIPPEARSSVSAPSDGVRLIWRYTMSEAGDRMGKWQTYWEAMAELRARSESP